MSAQYAGKSKVVAVAGASGGAGQHVAEALLSAGFTVVLLLRKENSKLVDELRPFITTGSSESVLQAEVVDFHSRGQLAAVFKQHRVDTVISALKLQGDQEWKVEVNLMQAAIDAGARRFSPSNYAGPIDKSGGVRWYEFKHKVTEQLKGAAISWTHITPGIFLNYVATGAPVKADGELPTGHLHPEKIIVDVEACTAKIPGTGDEPIALTEIGDVGRGVAAACALEAAWTPYTGYLVRETTTYNEVVRLAEGVRGRKFEITYIPTEYINQMCVPDDKSENPAAVFKTFYFEMMRVIVEGGTVYDKGVEGLAEACAAEGIEWKPVGMKAFLEKWWSGV